MTPIPARRSALRTLACAALAMLLAGCGLGQSQPTNFYLLDPIDPTAPRPTDGAVRLAVEQVEMPQYLDRQDIVTRDGGNALQVSGLNQWAEPLDLMVTRVLAENLRLLLDNTEVVELPNNRGRFNAELNVELLRFERAADGAVALVAAWSVVDGTRARTLTSRRAVIQAPVEAGAAPGTDYRAVVGAMNAALDELSRRIADSLQQAGAAT